jgi:hypothetical protein
MNIEHEGQTYEVLTLDRISEITHAKLAGGAVTTAKASLCGAGITVSSIGTDLTTTLLDREIEDFAVQPLRLVPVKPVTFEGVTHGYQTSDRDGFDLRITVSDNEIERLSQLGATLGKRFRCVEIVEEA